MNKAVFLDRDGTINADKEYLWRIEDFEFLPGAVEALRLLKQAGFLLIVISNQSGVARGYYTESDIIRLHTWMERALASQGVKLDGIYYCPHHPDGTVEQYRKNCDCRKPMVGLFLRAAKEHAIDFSQSYAVGDKLRDCAVCKTTDCRGFLIGDKEPLAQREAVKAGRVPRVRYAKDLLDCAQVICKSPAAASSSPPPAKTTSKCPT